MASRTDSSLRSRCWVEVSLLSLGILLSGCGAASGPGMTAVSGTVTLDGKPAGPGTVAFVPVNGTGNPATGNISASGSFQMSVHKPGDGVYPGDYKVAVTIEKTPAHGDEKGNLYPPTYSSPEKYMNPETSGFTITVEKNKPQTVQYDLKS